MRLLVACELVSTEIRYFFGGQLPVVAHHGGDYLPPELLIAQSYHSHLGHTGVLLEHLFHLTGVHGVAAADDQLLRPPADREIAILVHKTEIFRAEPPISLEGLFGGVWPVPVSLE